MARMSIRDLYRLTGSIAFVLIMVVPAMAEESVANSQKAAAAARTIINLAVENKLNTLWDKYTSQWFKSKTNKELFFQNLSAGRAQIGTPQSVKLSSIVYATGTQDLQGDIYTIVFDTTYPIGKFYERVVVLKEQDGEFRLFGLWSNPGPKD